jgi:tRNA-Thr(GGU) m(6)t(6)A37 methyltransferase TsaA
MTFTFDPIGVVRSPFVERASAPRQAVAGAGTEGTIELLPGRRFEDALSDIEEWERLWVLFVFHENVGLGWRPKVLPPRSEKKRGVFATRAPYRPNPIGMSVVRLLGVDGLVLRVADLDILDGSPVLDLKPYVPYADAFPDARTGWLDPVLDPRPAFEVAWEERAKEELAWLKDTHAVDLAEPIAKVLALGPQPHAYRRIRREGEGFLLALKEWRVRFRVDGKRVTVSRLASGFKDAELAREPLHRAFVARFGR